MFDNRPHANRPSRTIRRALRLVGWNVLFLIMGLVLIAIAGEAYFRLTAPLAATFMDRSLPSHFVPKVGKLRKPNTETRYSNGLDFWTIARTNSLGFLDREPVSPERAAASCHMAVIGDSYVEAAQVAISKKFHVLLEELAARELPELDITASAFGIGGTGQINQLPFYDEFARHLRPKLLVLVFVSNDFINNSALLEARNNSGTNPDRLPWLSAAATADGTIVLRPPDPEWRAFRSPRLLEAVLGATLWAAAKRSYFAHWVNSKIVTLSPRPAIEKSLREQPQQTEIEDSSYEPSRPTEVDELLHEPPHHRSVRRAEDIIPNNEITRAMAFTAFALDQFQERAVRDGVSLVILASHNVGGERAWKFRYLRDLATARGIPVIDQYEYILRQGGRIKDARWTHDGHWNIAGHRWAAEVLLEWLRQHPDVCD